MKKILTIAAILLAVPAAAHADFLAGFTGNTSPGVLSSTGGLDGTINFTVLDKLYDIRGDAWGSGFSGFNAAFRPGVDQNNRPSPALDVRAKYIYIYQVVNDGPTQTPIDLTAVRLYVDPSYITSWGTLSNLGFADIEGEVSATNVFGKPHDFANPAGMNTDVTDPKIISLVGSPDVPKNPDYVTLYRESVEAEWSTAINAGQRSSLFCFTSNLPPGPGAANIQNHCGHVGQPKCP